MRKSPRVVTIKKEKKSEPLNTCGKGQYRNIFTGECEVSKEDTEVDDEEEEDEESNYYLNLFLQYVDELPFITYEEDIKEGHEPYTREMLIEDIVQIIKDIYEQTEYVLIPDSITMLDIATLKYDNEDGKHNKEVKEFLFGTQKGNDAVHNKIREFTKKIEPNKMKKMEEKYKRLEEMNPNEPPLYDSEGTVSDSEDILMKAVERLDIKEIKVKLK